MDQQIEYLGCNKGKLKDSIIYFHPLGMTKVDDNHYIKDDAIFLVNGFLQKKGIVVSKQFVDQQAGGLTYRSQDYFVVIDSNCSIPDMSAIICKPHSAVEFDYSDNQYAYVDEDNVLLVVNDSIKAGPGRELVKQVLPSNHFRSISKTSGELNGEIIHFTDIDMEIGIEKDIYYVVPKKNIYAKT